MTVPVYPNEIYSAFAFLGFILMTIPLPWHLEAWNTGTCCYMIWTGLGCLNMFINSIVWKGRVDNIAPVWCDISTKYIIGVAVAIPACSLCINRRLYHIATANTVTITRAEKRRAVIVDLAICVGLPILQMILHYIPQGHRFDIFEDVGCYPTTYNTWVAFVLVWSWPVVIGCVSAVYCTLSLIAFNKRRTQFKELLSKNSNLTSNRYFRLMCLAGIEILCTIPLGSWAIYLDATASPVHPWISWEDTKWGFDRAELLPSLIWHLNDLMALSIELTRWFTVICALIFFAFFGFADEARKNYRAAYSSVTKHVGLSTTGTLTGTLTSSGIKSKGFGLSSNGNSLPVFVRRETSSKRDSLESFTDVSVASSGKNFNEKSFDAGTSFGALSLADVGGALADTKPDPYAPSSGSSSGSSSFIASPTDTLAPPPFSHNRDSKAESELDIEISSLRYSITPPEAAHVADSTPSPNAGRRNSADMV
ncbi:pheromone receptor [Moniliophthora roreri MCA 2997]|uniref:Pheromone receptor n=2 Tax=Moniliophthora roreri TaxID=221103 RepID=V2WXA2_MONRO|nr:pheromone receptor [Moniliophthora roreri MCA 2997]KAI3603971.1 putative STE3-like pheromone receptor STE3_Mr2 [Moniliophthora roreri]